MPFSKKPFTRRNHQHKHSWRDYQTDMSEKNPGEKRPQRRIARRTVIVGLFTLIAVFGLFQLPPLHRGEVPLVRSDGTGTDACRSA